MSELINLFDVAPSPAGKPDVEIFDPPMCCSTGLCGPTLDQTLLDVNEMLLALQAKGLRVERYQMTTSPQAFLGSAEVMRLIGEQQLAALPITVVRGNVLKAGSYPSLDEVKTVLTEKDTVSNGVMS